MVEERAHAAANATNAASGAPQLPGRIPSLDGLRAISIGLVFLGHVAFTRGSPAFLDKFSHVGNLGVKVFFVISGFLITTLLLKEHARRGRISLRSFYVRRTLRIFPAFYFYIATIVALQFLGYVTLMNNDLIHAVTYTMNYHDERAWELNHLWSLAVEEQFYLLWPVLLCALGPRKALIGAGIVVMLAPVCRAMMWYQFGASPTAMTRQFQAVADALATGCLLAGCYNSLGTNSRYMSLLRSGLFLLLPGTVLLLAGLTALYSRAAFYILGQSFCHLAIVLCIDRYVRCPETVGGRLLNSRPLIFIGLLSYSFYLWQQLFLNPMNEVPYYTGFPQNLFFVIVAGLLSYHLIEKPFLKLKSQTKREPSLSRGDCTVSATEDDGMPVSASTSAGQPALEAAPIPLTRG